MAAGDLALKNFVADGSERAVQDVIAKLKFISKIKEDEIVDVASLTLMEAGWPTSIYRTLIARGESRKATFEFFRQVVTEAYAMATKYLSYKEDIFWKIGVTLMDSLRETKAGLLNHKTTYKADRMHEAKVDTLLRTLDTKIEELQSMIETIPGYKNNGIAQFDSTEYINGGSNTSNGGGSNEESNFPPRDLDDFGQ